MGGVIYAVHLHCLDRTLDIGQFFHRTQDIHEHVIHLLLSGDQHQLSVTIPGAHGVEKTTDLVFRILHAAMNSRGIAPMPRREHVNWPEYVLWPDHPLAFYSDELVEPILRH